MMYTSALAALLLASAVSSGSAAPATNTFIADFVIVGGGTAGLTVAHQFAVHTPKFKVVVLEAGDDWTASDPSIDVPINEFVTYTNPRYDWGFVSQPIAGASGIQLPLARFRGLGGCSQHNGEGFWLASRFAYNEWPNGFHYNDIRDALEQIEGCVDFGLPTHGVDGPLYTKLDDMDQFDPYLMAWKQAALDAGYPFSPDENVPKLKGYSPHVITIKDGVRYGPYHMFKDLGPQANLTVHINTTATKLLTGGNDDDGDLIITGVKATRVDSNGVSTQWKYLANKAVIIAAGAYKSPQLLMVSGIGDPAVLNAAGIDVKKRLKGVGKNLKEHPALPFIFNVSQISPINNATFFAEQAAQYDVDRTGYFAYPTFDHAGVQVSTDNAFNGRKPDVTLTTSPYNFFGMDPSQMLALVALQNPESVGSVTVTSDDINDPPVIDLNFFSAPNDLIRLKRGIALMREIVTQPSFSSWYNAEYFPTEFAPDDLIKTQVFVCDHPMGTCMMGRKNDENAVVDNEGAVFKTDRLYIADASIIPTTGDATPNVSIHGTVILVAKIIANNLMCKFGNVCL